MLPISYVFMLERAEQGYWRGVYSCALELNGNSTDPIFFEAGKLD